MRTLGTGMHWQDFEPGDRFRTLSRSITEADITNFTNVTGMTEALFNDLEYIREHDYEDVYDRHRGSTTRGALFGDVSAADVADEIYRAAVAPSPPARVPVGTRVTWALRLARVVPRHWRDRVYDWLG